MARTKELEGIKGPKRYSEDFTEHLGSILRNIQDLLKTLYHMPLIGARI